MFGFIIGFASLFGLIAVLRGARRRNCHGRGFGRGEHHHEGGGRGPRGALRFLFRKLDTTSGQEKEIKAAVEELFTAGKALREESRKSRDDVATLLRTETLDETVLGGLFSRHDDRLRELQKAFADALGRVHQALDPAQREQLAKLLESGEHGPGFGGPYRGWA